MGEKRRVLKGVLDRMRKLSARLSGETGEKKASEAKT